MIVPLSRVRDEDHNGSDGGEEDLRYSRSGGSGNPGGGQQYPPVLIEGNK